MPTNPGGEFGIPHIPVGVYTIFYDAPGYVSQTQEVIPVYEGQTTKPPMAIMSGGNALGAAGTGEIYGKVFIQDQGLATDS